MPAGAPTLIYADLAAIRASTFYRQRPDRGPITIPDRDYADFVQSTGFDFENDLDRVVIASWPAGLSPDQNKQDQNKTVVVADGRFDRGKIRDYALRKGKLDRQGGRDVFLFPNDNRPGWNSITFLDEHRIAIVEGPSIAPLLATRSIAGVDPARERAAHVAGAAVFAISRVPPIPDNFAPGGVQSAQLMNLARSVQWVTFGRAAGGKQSTRFAGRGMSDSHRRARTPGCARGISLVRARGPRKSHDASVHGSRHAWSPGYCAEDRGRQRKRGSGSDHG